MLLPERVTGNSSSTATKTSKPGNRTGNQLKDDTPTASERSKTEFDRESQIEQSRIDRMSRAVKREQASDRIENSIERDGKDRLGRSTQNDGRADGGVVKGGHAGARDTRIETLKRVKAKLDEKAAAVEARIKVIDSELKNDEHISGVVTTIVDVASAPVGFVAGLFGAKNPVTQAAKSASEFVLGIEAERAQLVEQKALLDRQRGLVADNLKELRQERILNLFADVAHSTRMPESVVKALEGNSSIKIEVVKSTGLGSDAAYDSSRGAVLVDEGLMKRAQAFFDELRRQGIVDEDGNILDAERFDASVTGDKVIGTTALIGVHEMVHAAQDGRGEIRAAHEAGDKIVQTAGPNSSDQTLEAAYVQAELKRIDLLEYDAYATQESLELQAGKQKQGFVTINPDGSLLPRQQAVANIYALTTGQPLVYGVSAGKVFGDSDSTAGSQVTPGMRTPGMRTPGEETPGMRTPGMRTPGMRTPGEETPGMRTPGMRTPGMRTPGMRTPGEETPGMRTPGRELA